MDNELLVTTIRELCKKHNIAISKLENDLNFGSGLISRWVKNTPSLDKIVDIADYFHISIDEVIGRKHFIKDEFIISLISMTESGSSIWKSCAKKECKAKRYTQKIEEGFKEKTYFTKYSDGFVSVYALYKTDDIIHPVEIRLFLQPDDDADLILQNYQSEGLTSLWLSILTSVDKNNKDVKAANMKKQISDKNMFVFIPTDSSRARFEHSLGTMDFAQMLNEKLKSDYKTINYTSSLFKNGERGNNDQFYEAIRLLLEWKRNIEGKKEE